jgi:hypothetical protein
MDNLHLYLLISLAGAQNFTAEDSLSEEGLRRFLYQLPLIIVISPHSTVSVQMIPRQKSETLLDYISS